MRPSVQVTACSPHRGKVLLADSKLWIARPNCFRLLTHWARRAASRADWTAGNKRAINTAMIAMTTSSSIRVKPGRRDRTSEERVIEVISPKRGEVESILHGHMRVVGAAKNRRLPD